MRLRACREKTVRVSYTSSTDIESPENGNARPTETRRIMCSMIKKNERFFLCSRVISIFSENRVLVIVVQLV